MPEEYGALLNLKAKGKQVHLKIKVDNLDDLKLLVDNEHILLQSLEHIFVGGKGVKRPRRTKKTSGGKTLAQEIEEVFAKSKNKKLSVKEIQKILEDQGTYFGTSNHYVAIYTTLTQSENFTRVDKGVFQKK
ncbi:MAG: hypothetical protein QCI38_08230 [Candidatus Thermoplasmatota archaeon]|nr:hypothetical protein [Candidatus Thermoplasmatota archaeon]